MSISDEARRLLVGSGALLLLGWVLWRMAEGRFRGNAALRRWQQQRQQLASAGTDAVVVKGQPGRAFVRWAPTCLVALLVMFGMPYVQVHGLGFLCGRLGVAETLRWTTALVCYGLPGFIVLITAVEVTTALRVLRGGYSPPLDAVLMQDTIAVTGWRAKARGWFGLVAMPLLAGGSIWLGLALYRDTTEPKVMARLKSECPMREATPGTR